MPWTPDPASLRRHPVPGWFTEARFGIFVHWSLSTIPAWAPNDKGDIHEVIKKEGFESYFLHNPYSEWYQNGLRLGHGPTWEHHRDAWGADYPYERFADAFNESLGSWDPAAMADAFKAAGARYVVLVTKHHDGFCLWPTSVKNPRRPEFHARRDVVGELSAAVRARGMRMGLYYSGAIDWTFTGAPIRDAVDMMLTPDPSSEYARYAEAQYRELIERYKPSVLWNDIAYPEQGRYLSLLADYYEAVPDGVVNDRWMQTGSDLQKALANPVMKAAAGMIARRLMLHPAPSDPGVPFDYSTMEYQVSRKALPRTWECVRGVGHSFGYTSNEPESNFLLPADAVRLLSAIASTNGNLLLNVGPKPGGEIQDVQLRCIRGIGEWLAGSGEAIYGTRPWVRPTGRTADGATVRFTAKGDDLYAIVDHPPASGAPTLADPPLPAGATVVPLPGAAPGMPLALKIAGGNRDSRGAAIRLREQPAGQPKAPKTVAALVREKSIGALAAAAVIAGFIALFGFNPATVGRLDWALVYAAATTFVLALLLPVDMAAQARKEMLEGRVEPDARGPAPARARGPARVVLPRALLGALAGTAAACAVIAGIGLLGIVLPPAALAAIVTAAAVVPVVLTAQKALPVIASENAGFILAPAGGRPVNGVISFLLEHALLRVLLMVVVNAALGLMIAAGQAAAGPAITAAQSQQSWGVTFLILVVACFGSSADYATGDGWTGRLRLPRRKPRIGGLVMLVLLVGLSYLAGFLYQLYLDANAIHELSPWTALDHKLVSVAAGTVAGCAAGFSWALPRAARAVGRRREARA